MTPTCVRCGRPAPDAWICPQDAQRLAEDLGEAAGHAEDAWTVIARQARYGGGSRGGRERPLPVDFAAADDLAAAENTLAAWARHIAEHTGAHPPTSLAGAARWIATQLDWLRQRPEAGAAFDELHYACGLLQRLVDRPGTEGLRLVGMCDCGRILYAPHGRDVVQCKASNCGARWDVDESQQILRAALDERLVTAAEAAHLAAFLDTDRTSKQIRALVDSWDRRRRIERRDEVLIKHKHQPRACEPGCARSTDLVAVYRFGDIAERVADTPRRAAHAAESVT